MESVAACAPFEVEDECAIAIKGPGVEPVRFLEESPMVFHDLYYEQMPTAPVPYLVAHALDGALKDRPCIAAFDLGQPEGRCLLECLTRQTRLRLFFLNLNLEPLEEQILDWDLGQRERARDLLAEALRDLDSIPIQEYDFSLAVSEIRSRY